ncbi:hypothetical protein CYY_009511 [Polysphondylium violaceum]|uniref:C2 domain-containing protein n=1 Tax=Polysphondylium violaceum TaxID=133409 RepID=A0A8J4V0F8_9MYCE|nr:hypothetical protein CYY_009511 [Polysphondylium violaceum]
MLGGTSDPYVKLKYNNVSYKTETIKSTTSPIWNFVCKMPMVTNSFLDLEVFDWERFGSNRSIGKCSVDMETIISLSSEGINDKWFQLDKKGFIQIGFTFTPPFPISPNVNRDSITNQQSNNNLDPNFNNNITSFSGILPPPVYLKPIFIQTLLTESWSAQATFSFPGLYSTKNIIAGQSFQASVILTVSAPSIQIRSMVVTLVGKTLNKGKKKQNLIQDYRDLLLSNSTFSGIPLQSKTTFLKGKHIIPFQFYLPKHCLSSVSIHDYSVQYIMSLDIDIVNLPDIQLKQNIVVVNLEDTVNKETTSTIEASTSKSPLTGGNIGISIKSSKSSFYQGEEIELDVQVVNNSQKKVKNIDIKVNRLDYEGTNITPITTNIVTDTKRLYPPIQKGKAHDQLIVVELPTNSNLIHSLSISKVMRVEYSLIVSLDIPKCVDLAIKVPISIVLHDPTHVSPLPDPLSSIASIPRYIKDWSPVHFISYIMFRKNCPEAITNNLDFNFYKLTGPELMTIEKSNLVSILQFAGPRTNELVDSIYDLIYQIVGVRNFLKDLQISNFISAFEKQDITFDLLPSLNHNDLTNLGLPIGDVKRFLNKIKEL